MSRRTLDGRHTRRQLCPFRSPSWDSLPRRVESVAFSRQLWRWILEFVAPSAVICLGDLATKEFGSMLVSTGARIVDGREVGAVGRGRATYQLASDQSSGVPLCWCGFRTCLGTPSSAALLPAERKESRRYCFRNVRQRGATRVLARPSVHTRAEPKRGRRHGGTSASDWGGRCAGSEWAVSATIGGGQKVPTPEVQRRHRARGDRLWCPAQRVRS